MLAAAATATPRDPAAVPTVFRERIPLPLWARKIDWSLPSEEILRLIMEKEKSDVCAMDILEEQRPVGLRDLFQGRMAAITGAMSRDHRQDAVPLLRAAAWSFCHWLFTAGDETRDKLLCAAADMLRGRDSDARWAEIWGEHAADWSDVEAKWLEHVAELAKLRKGR
jgi:hypothetical protein